MNAIPPRELAEDLAASRTGDAKTIRLSADYDEADPFADPPTPHGDAAVTSPRAPREGAFPAQLAGIEVRMSVEVGSLSLPLRDLMAVEPGQLFALDRMTSEPVSVLVNGKLFARGEIVAIGDRFGIRLVEIASEGAN